MNPIFWFLPLCTFSLAQATVTNFEFRECPNKQDTRTSLSCIKDCSATGANTSSYAVEPSSGTVIETVWEKGNKLTRIKLSDCHVVDTENWRCQSASVMMGGVVRREHYARSGRIFLNVSGSGGEQHYCSAHKNGTDFSTEKSFLSFDK